jgi:hypothetical protein
MYRAEADQEAQLHSRVALSAVRRLPSCISTLDVALSTVGVDVRTLTKLHPGRNIRPAFLLRLLPRMWARYRPDLCAFWLAALHEPKLLISTPLSTAAAAWSALHRARVQTTKHSPRYVSLRLSCVKYDAFFEIPVQHLQPLHCLLLSRCMGLVLCLLHFLVCTWAYIAEFLRCSTWSDLQAPGRL